MSVHIKVEPYNGVWNNWMWTLVDGNGHAILQNGFWGPIEYGGYARTEAVALYEAELAGKKECERRRRQGEAEIAHHAATTLKQICDN